MTFEHEKGGLRVKRRTLVVGVPMTLASLGCLALMSPEARAVAWPLLVIANVSLWFVMTLWNRDGTLPLFELGTVCVAVTAIYSAYPLLAFLLADLQWTRVSDRRLFRMDPSPDAIGGFAWRHVVYLVSFVLVYLLARGRRFVAHTRLRTLSLTSVALMLSLVVAISGYFGLIRLVYGVSYDASYRAVQLGVVGVPRDLPYFLQQVSHNLGGMFLILKLGLLVWLVQRWRLVPWRVVLIGLLGIEVLVTVERMGARSELVILLMASVMLYHRLVRPLTPRMALAVAVVLVGGALAYGFARDFAYAREYFAAGVSYWSAANEFQVLLGTAYDLHVRKTAGLLGTVPWQVLASDVLMLVPSQLLPFPKIDPSDWYLGVYRPGGTRVGLMFGAIAQAVVGYDWGELAARGAVLGLLFALIHRWYVRNSDSVWITLTYLCLCVWSYYTFRASTFYILYFVVYRLVPLILIVRVGSLLIARARTYASPRPGAIHAI